MFELISTEAEATRAHFTAKSELILTQLDTVKDNVMSESLRRQTEGQRERLFKTLEFDEMNARESSIEAASPETVSYIFPEHQHLSDCHFEKWLQSGQPLFWVNGKPGSGKSVLMKSLIHNPKTAAALSVWFPSAHIYQYFFYEMGSNSLQKSVCGCLRTLLYQLLKDDVDVLQPLLKSRPSLVLKRFQHDWSRDELLSVLVEGLRLKSSATCLFLDGLDEIQPNEKPMLSRLLKNLVEIPKLKVVVSSRPENFFYNVLGSYPTLQVHDLSRPAIRAYVENELKDHLDLFELSPSTGEGPMDTLVDNSEGVFLWAVLVVHSLLRGIAEGDSKDLLRQRIEQSPSNLNELYRQMWRRMNVDDRGLYEQEAANLLWAVLNKAGEANVLTLLLAYNKTVREELRRMVTTKGYWTDEDEAMILQRGKIWAQSRSAGLLHTQLERLITYPTVHFVHRSVKEFLEGTKEGREILDPARQTIREKWIDIAKALQMAIFFVEAYHEFIDLTRLTGDEFDDDPHHSLDLSKVYMRFPQLNELDKVMICLPIRATEEAAMAASCTEWMPPPEINPYWALRVFYGAAHCGQNALLGYLDKQLGVLAQSTSWTRNNILDICCAGTIANQFKWDCDWIPCLVEPVSGESWMRAKWARQFSCILWLLEHGAGPNTESPDAVNPKLYLGRFGKPPVHAVKFDTFLISVILMILHWTGQQKEFRRDMQTRYQQYRTDLQYFIAFCRKRAILKEGYTKMVIYYYSTPGPSIDKARATILVDWSWIVHVLDKIMDAHNIGELEQQLSGYTGAQQIRLVRVERMSKPPLMIGQSKMDWLSNGVWSENEHKDRSGSDDQSPLRSLEAAFARYLLGDDNGVDLYLALDDFIDGLHRIYDHLVKAESYG
ncbi:hypothetical protein GGR56DRAFT_617528 [Xylariaceae sp. FL0804]|nr:hypothetical protein GGR56DRAFT_617528 [Xylariaceae sp. FL0804]